jgi:hypothetical protein
MLTRVFLLFFLSIFATVGRAEKIAYEIYAIDEAGKPSLMGKGVKDYGDADLEIEERNVRGEIHWSKSLEFEGGFSIGASIYREPEVTGFGLWARHTPCGFSWEWFNATVPGHFKKLQETGHLSVAYRDVGPLKEITQIVFDTDVSLRLNESQEIHRDTHRILIKKGSVLKFPPNNSLHRTRASGAVLACAGR